MAISRAASPDSPLVSVLFTTYNAAPYLPAVCRSIQAQTYSNFEAIIFDDGSTDETESVLAPFKQDARFRIGGWKPNRGVNAAWREVLPMARGKYWASPGADDVLLPKFLEQRVALMEANPQAGMVHGAIETIDATGARAPNPYPEMEWPPRLDGKRALQLMLQHNFINQPSTMARCDLTQKILAYYAADWKYAQDWDLWILLLATGQDLLWDNRPLLQYRVHGGSSSGNVRMAAIRQAEVRLAPLRALRAAARYSPLAAEEWSRWGLTLYRLWLMRALTLRKKGALRQEWLDTAGAAFYGEGGGRSLLVEICRHGPGMALAALKQRKAVKHQSFRVAGLAEIDDPLFQLGESR